MPALLLLLSLLSFPALAADPDRLDTALDTCLAKPEGTSTPGMVECTGEAIRAWDKHLNEVYKQVMAGLDPNRGTCCARLSADGWRSAKPSMRLWEGRDGRTGARSSAC